MSKVKAKAVDSDGTILEIRAGVYQEYDVLHLSRDLFGDGNEEHVAVFLDPAVENALLCYFRREGLIRHE